MRSKSYIISLLFCGFIAQSTQEEQLLLVVELSRHGNREPSKMYNFLQPGYQNFQHPQELTAKGKKQHYELGKSLRQRYVEEFQFLSPQYQEQEFYIQATDRNRTILSAMYQIMGMYDEVVPTPEAQINFGIGYEDYISENQKIVNANDSNFERKAVNIPFIPEDDDFILDLNEDKCNRYWSAMNLTLPSPQAKLIEDYFQQNLRPLVENLTGMTNLNNKNLNDVCAYFQWATLDEAPFNFEIPQDIYNSCIAIGDAKQYSISYGLDVYWQLGAFEFLNKLLLFSRFAKQQYPLAYLKNKTQDFSRLPSYNDRFPKFVHYAGHSDNQAVVFEAIGVHLVFRVPPASCLLFEFFMEDNQLYLRILWKKDKDSIEILQNTEGRLYDKIPIQEAENFLRERLASAGFKNLKKGCNDSNISPQPEDYYSGEKALEELAQYFNLTNVSYNPNTYWWNS